MRSLYPLVLVAVLAGCGAPGQRAANTETITPTERPLPADPVGKAEELVRRQYAGDNNRGMRFLRGVTATETADGLHVLVKFNANDNLSMGFIRGGIEKEMRQTYEALFTSGEDVEEVTIGAFFTLIDNLGNESEELIYQTTLHAATGSQINWANASILDWENVWTVDHMHPEIAEAG